MKNLRKFTALFAAALTLCFFASCSNSSGGGGNATTSPTIYTITFNANDRSVNPARAAQTFSPGVSQNLKTIAELGFSKTGFNFVGWGTTADATESTYADGAEYTASANLTFYAIWSAVPVYRVIISPNDRGSVTASATTAIAGTEITLSNTPFDGFRFGSYTVIAEDGKGTRVQVTNGKFIMPAQDVTVLAGYSWISYSVNVGTLDNGSVTTSREMAKLGDEVTLTVTPVYGYGLSTLVVTGEDGTSVALSGTRYSRTFTMPAKNVTVMATFAALQPPTAAYTEIGSTKINGTEYDLVTFGVWPQTIKATSVTVYEIETLIYGDFTYCKGSDGQWYVKQDEKARYDDYKYSDGTSVAQSSSGSHKWFKVEPIKWRVLTTNYGGKKLLLAENILIGKRYDASLSNYQNSEMRKWLNSNSNSAAASDYSGSAGFLKSAFTAGQIETITCMSVDNSARSTNPDCNATRWNDGKNDYASDTPTNDKVFLLSEQEVTKKAYGFSENPYEINAASTRIRDLTDFAKATGALQQDVNLEEHGYWWLRSAATGGDKYIIYVFNNGETDGGTNSVHLVQVSDSDIGVVPALCVEN